MPATQVPNILIEHHQNLAQVLLDPSVDPSLKDNLIVTCFNCLSLNSISHAHHRYYYSVLALLAKQNLPLFCTAPIIEALSHALYGVISQHDLSSMPASIRDIAMKRHTYACLLAAKILHMMYIETEEWPTKFAISWVYDQLRFRLWSENPAAEDFIDNVRTAFVDKALVDASQPSNGGVAMADSTQTAPPSASAQNVQQQQQNQRKDSPNPSPSLPRYMRIPSRYSSEASINEVWQCTEAEVAEQIPKCDPKQIISVMQKILVVPRVRLLAAQNLEKWLNQGSTFKLAKDLLISLASHVRLSSESDIQIVRTLSMMKVKSNMLPIFSDCFSKLIVNNPSYPSIILSSLVYHELQSTSITNTANMSLLEAAYMGLPADQRAMCLGIVLRDVAANQQVNGAMLNKVVRRIIKKIASHVDVGTLASWLLQEKKEMAQAPRDLKERWIFQLAQMLTTICATLAVERGIPQTDSSTRIGGIASGQANHSPLLSSGNSTTPTTSGNNQSSFQRSSPTPSSSVQEQYHLRKTFAHVNNVAVAWIFLVAVEKCIPDLSSDRIVQLLNHVLFLDPLQNYVQVEAQQELKLLEYWFHDLPCEENTFHQLVYATVTEMRVPSEHFFGITHKLVIRAARLQATLSSKSISLEEINCLPIKAQEIVRAIFHACLFAPQFPQLQQAKLPQNSLWLRRCFWTACIIVLIITAFNHDSPQIASYTWSLPTMRHIMELLLTEKIHPLIESGTYSGWNLLPDEQQQVEKYCLDLQGLLTKYNVEQSFFQSGSIDKWLQLLTIPAEDSEIRHAPIDVLRDIADCDKNFSLGSHLRKCRQPDFLLQLIQEKGSQDSLSWLSETLEREPEVLRAFPVGLLSEIMMETLSKKQSTHSFTLRIAKQLSDKLFSNNEKWQQIDPQYQLSDENRPLIDEIFMVLQFFLGKLVDQSESVQLNAQKALGMILVPEQTPSANREEDSNTTDSSASTSTFTQIRPSLWLKQIPKLRPFFDNQHGRNILANTFASYIHHGTESSVLSALIIFALRHKILSPVKLSLEIASLFKNRPHLVDKMTWNDNDCELLRLCTDCFSSAYQAFKRTAGQPTPPHQQQDTSNTQMLILNGGVSFRIYPLFMEGYLYLLTLLVMKKIASNVEISIIDELLSPNTKYASGTPVVTPTIAKKFLSTENDAMLQNALQILEKDDPKSILLELASLRRGQRGTERILSHFSHVNDMQLQKTLQSLAPHQMNVFMIALTNLERYNKQFVVRVRTLLKEFLQPPSDSLLPSEDTQVHESDRDEMEDISSSEKFPFSGDKLFDDFVSAVANDNTSDSKPSAPEQIDRLLSEGTHLFTSGVNLPVLSTENTERLFSSVTLLKENADKIASSHAHSQLFHSMGLSQLASNHEKLMETVSMRSEVDLGSIHPGNSQKEFTPLLNAFYEYCLKENDNSPHPLSILSFEHVLKQISQGVSESSTTVTLEDARVHLQFILNRLPENTHFEHKFLSFLSSKFPQDQLVQQLIQCAESVSTIERRQSIFEYLINQFPSLRHQLVWERFVLVPDLSSSTEVQTVAKKDIFDFDTMKDIFIQCATYQETENIIDLLADSSTNHRRVLDVVLSIRSSLYSGYKYMNNIDLFPQWKHEHIHNLTMYFINELAVLSRQQRSRSSRNISLFELLLHDQRQAEYLSLLQEACSQNDSLLKHAVSVCTELMRPGSPENTDIRLAAQSLFAWIYSCFPLKLSGMSLSDNGSHLSNFLASDAPESISPALVSTLDQSIHRLCQYIRIRGPDPFMFQLLRMQTVQHPHLLLKRLGLVESLLEFGYSTSIDQFIEKKLFQTYEHVLHMIRALKPHIFKRVYREQLHTILERYFTIVQRLPSQHFGSEQMSNFFTLLVDFLVCYKRASSRAALDLLQQNQFVLTRLRAEAGSSMPQLLDKLHVLTSEALDSEFMMDEDDWMSAEDDDDSKSPARLDIVLRILQYKNPQHFHNSMEISAHNARLIEVLEQLMSEGVINSSQWVENSDSQTGGPAQPYFQLDSASFKLLSQALLRLCTTDDSQVRTLAYRVILSCIHVDPLNYQYVLPKYLELFHHPNVEVRHHAIVLAQEFAPYASEHTQNLLEALFRSKSVGLKTLTDILHRIHPIISRR